MTDQSPTRLADLQVVRELADIYRLPPDVFVSTFKAMALPPSHTEAEFVSSCLVVREHQLSPLTKEIYFARDKDGRLQAIVGLDGWVKKCNSHEQFDGWEFSEVRGADGKVEAMTCSIFRKDRSRPTTINEYFDECVQKDDKGTPMGAWKTHPSRQLRTRSLCQCARLAFGFPGIMERSEFDQWQAQGQRTPVTQAARQPVTIEPIIPEVPADDAPDIIDLIPEVDVDEDKGAPTAAESDTIAAIASAMDDAAPKFFAEVLDGHEDAIAALSEEGKRHVEEMAVGRLLKAYARSKAKAKFVDDVLPLLDKLSDPARRSVEAVFEGRKQS